MIFTRHALKTKKQLLFYVTDLVLQRVIKYRVSDLGLTDSPNGIWTHELIMCDLRVPPSDLLTHYMQSMDKEQISEQQCFERSLALILLWSSILTAGRESADLRSMLYQELCTHGVALYQKTLAGFCYELIRADKLALLVKADEQACLTLFERANKSMSDLLSRNVVNFNDSFIVTLPGQQQVKQAASPQAMQANNNRSSGGPRIINRTFQGLPGQVYGKIKTAEQAAAGR